MRTIDVKEAQGHLLEIIEAGESVRLTSGEKVVAELTIASETPDDFKARQEQIWANLAEIRARQPKWEGPSALEWLRELREGELPGG